MCLSVNLSLKLFPTFGVRYDNHGRERGDKMKEKVLMDKISIYIPTNKMELQPVERLIALGDRKDRSINYLVVEAIIQYLTREEMN